MPKASVPPKEAGPIGAAILSALLRLKIIGLGL